MMPKESKRTWTVARIAEHCLRKKMPFRNVF